MCVCVCMCFSLLHRFLLHVLGNSQGSRETWGLDPQTVDNAVHVCVCVCVCVCVLAGGTTFDEEVCGEGVGGGLFVCVCVCVCVKCARSI